MCLYYWKIVGSRMCKSMGNLWTKSESRKADFVPCFLDIFLNLIPVLSERKLPIDRRFLIASDERLVRRAEEVGNRVSLLLRICHYSVFYAFIHVIAPCLQIETYIFTQKSSSYLSAKRVLTCRRSPMLTIKASWFGFTDTHFESLRS